MKIFVPELNYWIRNRYFESEINEYHFDFPVELNYTSWADTTSVINLLFNDSFSSPSYSIYYKEFLLEDITDPFLRSRLVDFYNKDLRIFVSDSLSTSYTLSADSTNIFEINTEEQILLEHLLNYRNNVFDIVSFQSINYSDLQSNLSKLIYVYLQLMVFNNIEYYNNESICSDSNRLLELLFEKYVIDNYFRIIKNNYLILDSTTTFINIELNSSLERITINSTDLNNQYIELENIVYDTEDICVTLDGYVQAIKVDYDVVTENNVSYITWKNLNLKDKLRVGSKIIVSYSYDPSR